MTEDLGMPMRETDRKPCQKAKPAPRADRRLPDDPELRAELRAVRAMGAALGERMAKRAEAIAWEVLLR